MLSCSQTSNCLVKLLCSLIFCDRLFILWCICSGLSLLLFQAGTVWCNCWLVRDLNMPFGGVKASGIGREGAKESYEFYTEAKTICIKMWLNQKISSIQQSNKRFASSRWCSRKNISRDDRSSFASLEKKSQVFPLFFVIVFVVVIVIASSFQPLVQPFVTW